MRIRGRESENRLLLISKKYNKKSGIREQIK
jgi:hypothetical protein